MHLSYGLPEETLGVEEETKIFYSDHWFNWFLDKTITATHTPNSKERANQLWSSPILQSPGKIYKTVL